MVISEYYAEIRRKFYSIKRFATRTPMFETFVRLKFVSVQDDFTLLCYPSTVISGGG